ncbi:MAG: GntR family transcriptional regulator [Janthinobacterium lividum]
MTQTSSITTLPKTNLRDRVSSALRSAIISGEMAPGVVYSAPSLASRFGVSATPVREAMLDLVREGMVTIVPNKGFRVTEVDDASLDQVTQIRQLLEPPVVGRVTALVPVEDLGELRRMAQDIVDEAAAGDLVAYTEADRRFHLRLLAYDGNPRLVDLVSELRGQTRLLGLSSMLTSGVLAENAREHLLLVDLVEARDADAAEALMHAHIARVRTTWARSR